MSDGGKMLLDGCQNVASRNTAGRKHVHGVGDQLTKSVAGGILLADFVAHRKTVAGPGQRLGAADFALLLLTGLSMDAANLLMNLFGIREYSRVLAKDSWNAFDENGAT